MICIGTKNDDSTLTCTVLYNKYPFVFQHNPQYACISPAPDLETMLQLPNNRLIMQFFSKPKMQIL